MLQYMHVFRSDCALLGQRSLFFRKVHQPTLLNTLPAKCFSITAGQIAIQVTFLSQHNPSALQCVL